jgi:hypothetical protein
VPKQGGPSRVSATRGGAVAPADADDFHIEPSIQASYALGDTAFFTTQESEVWSRSFRTGALRLLAVAHHPAALLADEEAAYYVELGEPGTIVTQFSRMDCCAIWSAPR